MAVNEELLKHFIDSFPPSTVNDLERQISSLFDKCGLFYRIFSRRKSSFSTIRKLKEKEFEYQEKNKKMQDIIGIRIALYFKDDVDLCTEIISKNFSVIEIVRDEEKSDTFKPMRLNIVCTLPDNIISQIPAELWENGIDQTFEIQIRTIFSEGWHEVEHDFRYKHSNDWTSHDDLSRNLNGIFATLETCDWAILNILSALSYEKYRSKDWGSMLRNVLRIRMDNSPLSSDIIQIFNNDIDVAKEFLRIDRKHLMELLSNPSAYNLPKSLNNIVFFANATMIHNNALEHITPNLIKNIAMKIVQ